MIFLSKDVDKSVREMWGGGGQLGTLAWQSKKEEGEEGKKKQY